MAVNDPTQPAPPVTLNDVVTPIVQQAVGAVTADTQARLPALEQQLAAAATAQAPVLVGEFTQAAGSVLTTVEHDPVTQRVLVWGIVGAVLLAALGVIGFALLGNQTANRWVGAAPTAVVGIVLWVSSAGVPLRKRTTTPTA